MYEHDMLPFIQHILVSIYNPVPSSAISSYHMVEQVGFNFSQLLNIYVLHIIIRQTCLLPHILRHGTCFVLPHKHPEGLWYVPDSPAGAADHQWPL